MNTLKPIKGSAFAYDHIVATGGIGTGIFFDLDGNDTLGREESRPARLLPYKDYCKQHIILHYLSVLLGGGKDFNCYAIGKVGNDEPGHFLVTQMRTAGINTDHVAVDPDHATMYSVCYQYPDRSGGNITTADSASSKVSPADIDTFFATFPAQGKELILAAPEVPVATRIRLLEHGRHRNSLNIASIASAEIAEFTDQNGFQLTDMLFINVDEARAIAKAAENASPDSVVLTAMRYIRELNANITILITCGAKGVYCYKQRNLEFSKARPVQAVSTAGAGDAFLAGTVAGICCGMPLFKFKDASVRTAVDIGLAVAAASVTSPDTINTNINADFLSSYL